MNTDKWRNKHFSLAGFLWLYQVGYCGADIKALCTEAAMRALRRRYPQIYDSSQKLIIQQSEVVVLRQDFVEAMRTICPAANR